MRADQKALGAAEAWPIDQQADVTSEPEPPRMCESVTVEQECIRLTSKFLQHGEDGWGLTKREQTRYVWETNGAADYVLFYDRLRLDIPHDDAGDTSNGPACRLLAVG